MLKRYPYWGWLLLSILLWCLAWLRYSYHEHKMQPQNMTAAIQQTLNQQEKSFEELLQNTPLVNRIFTEKLTGEDIEALINLPYRLYAYTNESELVFWNNNKTLEDCNNNGNDPDVGLVKNEKGVYVKRCVLPYGPGTNKKLVVLFPIVKLYPFENTYLKSHFIARADIPVNTRITSKKALGSYEVRDIKNHPIFYLSFIPHSIAPWTPDMPMSLILILAVFFSVGWLQLITISLSRKKSFWPGLLLTISFIVIFRFITYRYGLPLNLDNLLLFSPQLYASSNFLKSLGDVLINGLCYLWIVLYVLQNVPYKIPGQLNLNKTIRLLLGAGVAFIIIIYAFAFINIVRSLVLDSMISFDVSHFYSVTTYTIIGLFTICVITGASCILIFMLNALLQSILRNKLLKYIVIAIAGTALIVLSDKDITGIFSYILLAWLILFIILLDIKKLINISDILAPQMVFWGIFICAFCTTLLQYFNYRKEHETRKRFAEQVVYQKDELTVYTFRGISQSILRDRQIKFFFSNPTQEGRRNINERFDALYLGGQLNKYQSKVLLFDKDGKQLYNTDTVSYASLLDQIKKADVTSDTTLYYKEYAQNGHYYIAHIPIRTALDSGSVAGHVFIDFANKTAEGESVYPELLQPANVQAIKNESGYSYAVYVNKRLILQTNDYSFPVYLADSLKSIDTFFELDKRSELWHKSENEKTVVVVYFYRTIQQAISLFSYLFGIQMAVVLIVIVYRTFLTYFSISRTQGKIINLTLRKRIHFSMLGIVFISFIIIGLVTVVFFNYQYSQSNSGKLRKLIQTVEASIVQYAKSHGALDNAQSFNELTNLPPFKYFISNLSNLQKTDINIYNASGVLSVTSQENIYEKALLARIIMPDAYYNLDKNRSSLYIQNEKIGELSYLSSYAPILDQQGNAVAYINVPYFASDKEVNYQISNILVALINLYAFIFLISGLLTVFITQWITRTFNVVIDRFEKLSLTENERIEWPYEDEIGLLVREYNKMVAKVEGSAMMLAQSEREGAWREMAKQVAHEIQNPLTPMKLNIQYLQQALNNNYPNVNELAMKVSKSLIEQIDNLAYIANEFSNFAKMPEAKPTLLELNKILEESVALYLNEENFKVSFNKYPHDIYIVSDLSQLRRIFSNLLENATQSIPNNKHGIITVSLKIEDGYVIISFSDNGTGIDPATTEKIFQPYFTTKSSGTGLGLAMTKKIIESWNGKIWFETEMDKGTTFFIKLPYTVKE